MNNEYTAVRVIKRNIMPRMKRYKGHQIFWLVSVRDLEEPNCDVALIIGYGVPNLGHHYTELQHKNRTYAILKFTAYDTPTGYNIQFVTRNGK